MAGKDISGKTTRKILMHLVEASALVSKLYKGDTRKVKLWMNAPNSTFFQDSPLEVILRGDGRGVIKWLKPRVGKGSAIAF